jgi:hypothetical protein
MTVKAGDEVVMIPSWHFPGTAKENLKTLIKILVSQLPLQGGSNSLKVNRYL